MSHPTRRELLVKTVTTTAATLIAPVALLGAESKTEPEVAATEDLMREHGVLRRALLIYAELADKIRQQSGSIDAAALHKAAQLFRTFGEDYHEKMLEEQRIFPIVRKMKGEAAKYPDILVAQHHRGREITDYMLAVTSGPRIASQHSEPLARAIQGFVLMYQNHAAREDTIVFPAWKQSLTAKQLDEISDHFEDIEHKMFGADGFEDAEKTIGGIEQTFGLADISQFTAPAPPRP